MRETFSIKNITGSYGMLLPVKMSVEGEKAEVKPGSDLPPKRAHLVTLEADRPSGSDFFIFSPML